MPRKKKTTASAVDTAQIVLSKADATKKSFDGKPKVMFMIPLAKGDRKGATYPVMVNGYRMDIPMGVMTEVPSPIATILAQRFNVGLDTSKVASRSSSSRAALEE